MRRLAMAAALLLFVAAQAAAQEPRTAVVPDTITIGDVFRVAIRVDLPPGAEALFPDTLDVPPNVEAAARRTLAIDTTTGRATVTAVYALTAWRPGSVRLPPVRFAVLANGARREMTARVDPFTVQSVLPADTSNVKERPPKDVLGADRLLWPLLLLLLLLLALLALAFWLYRRRRPAAVEASVVPALPPREAALAALDRARESGLVEAGDLKGFHTLVTDAVRHYVAALEPRWGADRTTAELIARMSAFGRASHIIDLLERGDGDPARARSDVRSTLDPQVRTLAALLESADLVKFARHQPTAAEAYGDWQSAREWVERFEWPPRATMEARAA